MNGLPEIAACSLRLFFRLFLTPHQIWFFMCLWRGFFVLLVRKKATAYNSKYCLAQMSGMVTGK